MLNKLIENVTKQIMSLIHKKISESTENTNKKEAEINKMIQSMNDQHSEE